jgi:hypothetical protein
MVIKLNSDLIFLIICLILGAILTLLLPTTYKRLKDIPYLFWAIIMAFVVAIIYFLASLYRYITGTPFMFLQNLSLLPIDFVFLLLYLYFESLYTARIPEKRLLIFLFLFIFNFGINFFNSLDLFEYKNYFSFFATLTYFFGSIVAFFGLYVLIKTIKIYNARPVKIDCAAVLVLIIGLILFQISGISQYWYDWAEILFWIGNLMFVAAFGIIIINSIINGTYIYMIPNPIQLIFIYTSGGVLFYNRNFDPINPNAIKTDETMLSSAMSGFAMFFKDILGSGTVLNYIDAGAFQFFFEQLPENSGSFVVVTQRANKMLLHSMKKIVNNIPEKYLKRVKNFDGRMMIDEFDVLIKKYFPFLRISGNPM